MAQKVQVLLVDDLDGGTAEETVEFALNGSRYEIDLSATNAAALRKALEPFVHAARKTSTRTAPRRGRPATDRERSAQIRAWAKQVGKKVNERGRIPAGIVAAYEAANR